MHLIIKFTAVVQTTTAMLLNSPKERGNAIADVKNNIFWSADDYLRFSNKLRINTLVSEYRRAVKHILTHVHTKKVLEKVFSKGEIDQ